MVGPESYVIEIEKEKVSMLLGEFRNDASLLAQHLKIMNNRMVLLNPRFQPKDANDGQQDQGAETTDAAQKNERVQEEEKKKK
jgi:hypothetical protein